MNCCPALHASVRRAREILHDPDHVDCVVGCDLTGHTGFPTGVAFSHDGKRIARCAEDQTVRLWDAVSGQEVPARKGHTNIIRSVAFSKDGHRLVSGG